MVGNRSSLLPILSCKSLNPVNPGSDKNYLTKRASYAIINTKPTAKTPKYAFFAVS